MPRLPLILLISWVYIGCASVGARSAGVPLLPAAPDDVATIEARRGGTLAATADGATLSALLRSAIAAPLTPDGVSPSLSTRAPGSRLDAGDCEWFPFDGGLLYPDGRAVAPEDVIAAWNEDLRDPRAAERWLLGPVLEAGDDSGATRLLARDGGLEICLARETHDLVSRLAHPALWAWRRTVSTEAYEGPGPFTGDGGRLVANRQFPGGGPLVERIELVESDDPVRLIENGRADIAIVYGRAIAALAGSPDLRMMRLGDWDRSYALWVNRRGRWVNDPRFRRWMAGVLDRQSMVDFLFDGRGAPIFRLLPPGDPSSTGWEPVVDRPLGRAARPRLVLLVDAADPQASSLARRIQAVLGQHATEVVVEPSRALAQDIASGRYQIALLDHHPPIADPALGLLDTLWPLGPEAGDALRLLERATWHRDPAMRHAEAQLAESGLLLEARLIPLVRLDAWLASRAGLIGLRAGRYGVLRLERAGWAR